jgi:hypothetical protein
MEDKRTNAQVLEQIRVEALAKQEQEEQEKNAIYKRELKNYFQGRPITEGGEYEPTIEEKAKKMHDHFHASCDYYNKVRDSIVFDNNGKYYVHPKNGQKVYFTHPSELPTLDNEYPENDTDQHGIKGNIPQDPNLKEKPREEPEPQFTCNGDTPTNEEITAYISQKIRYELEKLRK